MTPAPQSFARQVSKFYAIELKPNQTDTQKFWARIVSAEPGLAKRFAADSHSCLQQLLSLVARLNPHLAFRSANTDGDWHTVAPRGGKQGGKNNGKGKDSAKGSANPSKGKGKGGGKSTAQSASFASLKIPNCFTTPDGTHAPLTNACEVHDGLLGVAQVDHAVARDLLRDYYATTPFGTPCAVVTSMAGSAELLEEGKYAHYVTRFAAKKVTLPVLRGSAAGAKTTEALLFQLGPHDSPIHFNDPTVVHVLGDLDTGTTRGTAYIYKDWCPPNSFEQLAKECHDFVVTALGAANVDGNYKIRPQVVTTIEVQGVKMLRFRMTVLYHTKQREQLWSRGGTNGVFIGTYEGKDETTVIVTLPVKHTLAQALAIQRALPSGTGLGVVTTAKGLALRCRPEHRDSVALRARPDEAAAYGDLFSLKKEDSNLYIVHGVDGMITGPILHECLKRSLGWPAKPVRPDKSHSWGCRDWHVWATEPPRTTLVELRTNEGRQMSCEIT